MKNIFDTLIKYEQCLHNVDRQNLHQLEKLLHPDFKETTKSGKLLNKVQIIAALLDETTDPNIQSQNFHIQYQSETSALLIYESFQSDLITGLRYNFSFRSSLWILNKAQQW